MGVERGSSAGRVPRRSTTSSRWFYQRASFSFPSSCAVSFRAGVKDLEVMTQNLMTSAFETVKDVEHGVEIQDIFQHLSSREVHVSGQQWLACGDGRADGDGCGEKERQGFQERLSVDANVASGGHVVQLDLRWSLGLLMDAWKG